MAALKSGASAHEVSRLVECSGPGGHAALYSDATYGYEVQHARSDLDHWRLSCQPNNLRHARNLSHLYVERRGNSRTTRFKDDDT